MAKGERQEYTGYRVTSKINGEVYELGKGVKSHDGTRYDVKIRHTNGKKIKYHLSEQYIRGAIRKAP